jgi:RNA polymerase sigma factor (sigma-70 family)
MKVFISWSGPKSGAVANALHGWLPGVINAVDPFLSSADIHAGTRWQREIASELNRTNFGIVCVTRENQATPWLNFEAGALAKAVDLSRVIPLAIDLKSSDVKLPLGEFQAQPADEDGLWRVVQSLNQALEQNPLTDELLRNSFEKWWPELAGKLASIEEEASGAAGLVRTDRELLEETLNTVRALARGADGSTSESIFDALRIASHLRRALDALAERERTIVILRYGLEGVGPLTLEEIGRRMHLSRERVRQVEAEAISRLAALRNFPSRVEPDENA